MSCVAQDAAKPRFLAHGEPWMGIGDGKRARNGPTQNATYGTLPRPHTTSAPLSLYHIQKGAGTGIGCDNRGGDRPCLGGLPAVALCACHLLVPRGMEKGCHEAYRRFSQQITILPWETFLWTRAMRGPPVFRRPTGIEPATCILADCCSNHCATDQGHLCVCVVGQWGAFYLRGTITDAVWF